MDQKPVVNKLLTILLITTITISPLSFALLYKRGLFSTTDFYLWLLESIVCISLIIVFFKKRFSLVSLYLCKTATLAPMTTAITIAGLKFLKAYSWGYSCEIFAFSTLLTIVGFVIRSKKTDKIYHSDFQDVSYEEQVINEYNLILNINGSSYKKGAKRNSPELSKWVGLSPGFTAMIILLIRNTSKLSELLLTIIFVLVAQVCIAGCIAPFSRLLRNPKFLSK